MSKNKQFSGIDISKDVFDVMDHSDNHYQFKNNLIPISPALKPSYANFSKNRKNIRCPSHRPDNVVKVLLPVFLSR